jgi:hypothetical protein
MLGWFYRLKAGLIFIAAKKIANGSMGWSTMACLSLSGCNENVVRRAHHLRDEGYASV